MIKEEKVEPISDIEGLPHQPSDLKPDEIIESGKEQPLPDDSEALKPEDELTSKPQPKEPLPQVLPTPTTLPKQEVGRFGFLNKLKEWRRKANIKRQESQKLNLNKIMIYARERERVINDEVIVLTGVSDQQALNYLKELVKQGKLERKGKKKNIFYQPT